MALQWADPVYSDGELDIAEPCGFAVFSSPMRGTTAEYIYTQDWMCSRRAFTVQALNVPHPSAGQLPDYSAWVLVSEGPRQDMGGGMVKWQRTYAKVPASHDEYESYGYSFIGFWGLFSSNINNPVTVAGRPRVTHVVTSRVAHDYFLVGTGQTYESASAIPQLTATRYFAGGAIPDTYE